MNEPDRSGYRALTISETLRHARESLRRDVARHDKDTRRSAFCSLPLEDEAAWSAANEAIRAAPRWAGEAGAALLRGSDCLLIWLAPRPDHPEAFPSELILDLDPGRHCLSTWDTKKHAVTGSEVCFDTPAVAGPPFCGHPLVILVTEQVGDLRRGG